MSFSGNIKYNITWVDYFDQSCELRIRKSGYAGASSFVVCGPDPIEITFETPSDFVLAPVCGSMATIYLKAQTDFEFLNLYTSNARQYKVQYLVGGSVVWSGFILPDQYQEEYKCAPYTNSFVAVDQLGFLKTVSWDKESVSTILEALGWILEKTDLELNLREGINVYEADHDSAASDSPLDQTYFNSKAYRDKTYYDALYDILFKFGAVLKQRDGEWFIFRPIEARSAFTTRLWTYSAGAFSYSSNTSTNIITATTSSGAAGLVRITRGQMFINPAWKKYIFTQDYRRIENILENGDFANWNDSVPKHWNNQGISYTPDWRKIIRAGNKLRIPALSPFSSSKKWYQKFLISGDVFTFRFMVKYFINHNGTGTMTIRFGLHLSGGISDQYYDFNDEEWKTYYTYYERETEAVSDTQQVTIDIITKPDLASSDQVFLSIELYQPEYTSRAHIDIDDVSLAVYEQQSDNVIVAPQEENVEKIELNPDNNYDAGDYSLMVADLPANTIESRLKYYGGLWTDPYQVHLTQEWTSPETTGTLIDILKNQIAQLCQNPQQVLTVPVYSKLIDSCSVLQEINNSDRYFLLRRSTWNPKYGRWDVEAHEIGIAVLPPLVDEDGNALLDEDGNEMYG